MSLFEHLPPYDELTSAEVRMLTDVGKEYIERKASILGLSPAELFKRLYDYELIRREAIDKCGQNTNLVLAA